MDRRCRTRSGHHRAIARLLAALMAGVLAGPGVALAQGGGEGNTPPLIVSGSVSPGSLPYTGGSVTISARVTDDNGIQQVGATVIGPDGGMSSVTLLPSEIHGTNDATYSAQFDVPSNLTDQAVSWGAEVAATDTDGEFVSRLVGDVQVDAQPQFDEPPVILSASVDPPTLPSGGGEITIRMRAYDTRGISAASANVTFPGGGGTQIELVPVSADDFEATYAIPPNTGPTAVRYGVQTEASDDIGQQSFSDPMTVTVAAATLDPFKGVLKPSPRTLNFGNVPVGSQVKRTFRLRAVGQAGRAPVSGVLRAGAPYRVVGATAEGLPFTLGAGESLKVTVAFRPKTLKRVAGAVRIERGDGVQQGLSVALLGRGT